ncbi:hypothetical protein B0T17DRAFT_546331 [Bombardia bombarda]|uniref:Uncharacterized protein n=1 Tax=Bombardia bombarda TaxID=252184 RepID=A0AA39TVS7_9PEZI|nr:hypothetical protein B0T17DRAFT_546331 [Bombardia bombarda]
MCKWEQILYTCDHRGEIRRMEYSCDIYTRFREGLCDFNKRRNRVHLTLSSSYCDDCRRMFTDFTNIH